jgi:hypothetical protein
MNQEQRRKFKAQQPILAQKMAFAVKYDAEQRNKPPEEPQEPNGGDQLQPEHQPGQQRSQRPGQAGQSTF